MMSTNYQISLEILGKIEAPRKIIGGAHATLNGDTFGKNIDPNYLIIKGEPENIFLDILNGQQSGVIDAGKLTNLDGLPFVDRSLFDNDPYSDGNMVESAVSTARGCLFSCVFCSVPSINGRKIRARSINNVVQEIQELQSQGVNSIHFIDDLFNYDKQRLGEFCDTLIDNQINIGWRSLVRSELLNEKLLERMKTAGCYKLAFGVESGTPRILKYIGKCPDPERVKRVFSQCHELGIETKAFFTMGYPSETESEIRRTMDFSLELGATEANFMIVRAFPGTPLYEEMRSLGVSEEELLRYKQFQDEEGYVKYHVMNFRSLNGLSNKKLDNMVREAYGNFYKKPKLSRIA